MLSYRHGFHAGNLADVLKHSTLIAVLEAAITKPAPLVYIDTHAGAGMYSLRDDGEQCAGVALLHANPERPLSRNAMPGSVKRYLDLRANRSTRRAEERVARSLLNGLPPCRYVAIRVPQ